MNPERLLRHFDRISEAPDAVPRLRRFILDLAVRGKLVEQAPNDEPVSVLLRRIDKDRAVTAKVDRRADAGSQKLLADELCWRVPANWSWRGVADLVLFIDYRGKTPIKTNSGIRLLTAKNVRGGFINLNPEEFITETSYREWMTRGFPRKGDILFTTEAPMGNAAVVHLQEKFGLAQRVINFRPYGDIDPNFLVLQILSEPFQTILDRAATGLTAKGIKAAKLKRLPLAVPPLAEQHRIVAKVDELMALCDELEAAQAKREKRRDRLVAATLHGLNNGDENGESGKQITFEESTCFYFNHLPRLTTRPVHIQQLRQTILNLAVRGKLVQQIQDDEPVDEFLHRIGLKETNSAGKSIKQRTESLAKDLDNRKQFGLPAGWKWIKLQNLLEPTKGISYGIIKLGPVPKDGGIPTLRCSDVKPRCLNLTGVRTVSKEIERAYTRTRLKGGEVLLNVRGTLGGVASVPDDLRGYNIAREVAVIPFHKKLSSEYLVNMMASPFFWNKILENLRGLAYKGLNLNALRSFKVPLPPIAEQHRIVAKVDKLMTLCDELEAQITSTTATRRQLLEATIQDALSA